MSVLAGNTLHQSQIITLKSREYTQRLNGEDNSDILFQLQQPINVPPNVDVYCTLHQFRFINAEYNVPNSSHIFYWRALKHGNWDVYQYAVPVGNWSIDLLITELNNNIHDFIFTYDPKTFRTTITAHQGSHTQYEIQPFENNILARIGFDQSTLISLVPTQSITSPNLIDLLGTQNLYVVIDDLQLGSNGTAGFAQQGTIDHIAIIVPQGVGQTYTGNGLMLKCGVRKLTQMRVQLFTGEGILAELNNTEWYLTLIINFDYEREFKPARYFTDVNGDGRIDVQDMIAMYQQQMSQQVV